MYTLFAWTLVAVLHTHSGDKPVYQWTRVDTYPTLQVCERVAHTELHLPKHKCIKGK